MKLHSLTADTPAGCVTYHSLTVDLPLQRYFLAFFTRVSTCICIRLHHFSNRGESRTVPRLRCLSSIWFLMRWFVSSVSGKNKRTHTHTQHHHLQCIGGGTVGFVTLYDPCYCDILNYVWITLGISVSWRKIPFLLFWIESFQEH